MIDTAAKSLSRNPLGIISLFIVLVYAVASIVLSLAKEDFYRHPFHPAVLFLAIFPLVVLLVFAYLVARHHRNLYAPQDYKMETHFFGDLKIPQAVLNDAGRRAATSDVNATQIDPMLSASLAQSYNELVAFGYVLVHQTEVLSARTSPGSGRYRVRVWIEPISGEVSLSDISTVTYQIWPDFSPSSISTADRASNFDLWLSVYGEFPVVASVTNKAGKTVDLQRYIDLPGRPPD